MMRESNSGREEASLSVRRDDGTVVKMPLHQLSLEAIDSWAPWRSFRWVRGQAHFPGYYWSSTMGGHVGYESLLERDRLMLADFDPNVTAIKSQAFLLEIPEGKGVVRNVLDYLLVRKDGPPHLVNVKPEEHAGKPKVVRVFSAVARAANERGWVAEVWTGADRQELANVRFLEAFRRLRLIDPAALACTRASAREGVPLSEIERVVATQVEPRLARPAVLHLVWTGELVVDLARPLEATTEVIACHA